MYEDEGRIRSYESVMATFKYAQKCIEDYLLGFSESDNDLFEKFSDKEIEINQIIVDVEYYIPVLNRLLDQPKETFDNKILEIMFDTESIKKQKEQIKDLETEFNRIKETCKVKLKKEDIVDILSVIKKSFEIYGAGFEVVESSRLRTKQLTHFICRENIGYA